MADQQFYAWAQSTVQHPGATAEMLQQIAQECPELRQQVLAHPHCYPGLTAWINAQGTPPAQPAAASAPVGNPYAPPGAAEAAVPATSMPAPTGQPMAPPTGQVPVVAQAGPGAEGPQGRKRNRRLVTVAAIAGGVLVLGAGGAYAFQYFMTGGFAAAGATASAFPASTVAMAEFSMDPTLDQKKNAQSLLEAAPELAEYFEDTLGEDTGESSDLREFMWDSIFGDSSFDESWTQTWEDIDPWLGGHIAVGLDGAANTPEDAVILAIEAKDVQAGVASIETMREDMVSAEFEVSSRGSYVLVTNVGVNLDRAFEDGDLNSNPDFAAVQRELGAEGLAMGWVSKDIYSTVYDRWAMQGSYTLGLYDSYGYDAAGDLYAEAPYGSGFNLRLTSSALELEMVGAAADWDMAVSTNAVDELGSLPADTLAAMSIAEPFALIDQALNSEAALALAEAAYSIDPYSFESPDDALRQITTGLDDALYAAGLGSLDDMVEDFPGGVSVAVDSDVSCLVDQFMYYETCSDIPVGLVMDSTPEGSDRVADLVRDLAEYTYEVRPVFAANGDKTRTAVGFGSWANALVEDSGLAQNPSFTRVIPKKSGALFAAYVDLGAVYEEARSAAGFEVDPSMRALEDFDAFGMVAAVNGDGASTVTMRVSVGD